MKNKDKKVKGFKRKQILKTGKKDTACKQWKSPRNKKQSKITKEILKAIVQENVPKIKKTERERDNTAYGKHILCTNSEKLAPIYILVKFVEVKEKKILWTIVIIRLLDSNTMPKENTVKCLRCLLKENAYQRVYIQQNWIEHKICD